MKSTYNTREFVSDSQNFALRLSAGSSIEDTCFASTKADDTDDIIEISDSSFSLSPKPASKLKWESASPSNIKNKKTEYQKLYFLMTSSSESEEGKLNPSRRNFVRSDNKSLDREYRNKTIIQINKAFHASDKTTSSSDNYNNANDRDTKDQTNKSSVKKFYKSPTLKIIEQKMTDSEMREKYNVKETNKLITNQAIHSNSPNIIGKLNKLQSCDTPQENITGKIRFTKEDAWKIFKNIKSTQIMYNSPRENKETNVIIDDTIDGDEDVIYPALSSKNNINIIPDSQLDLSHPSKTCISKFFDISKKEDLHKSLSEIKKRQIAEWLMTNLADSQSSSSYSNVSPSGKTSIGSGNSSLERLEQNYETPNNRGIINKVQTNKKQTTIVDSERIVNPCLTGQTILNRFVQKSKNNNSECTPDKPKLLPKAHTDKKTSSVVTNTPENMNIRDCTDILDKLYGNSWRDKANALLPKTEPRKTSLKTINRATQTERKPTLKNKYYVSDSDSDKSDTVENNILSRKKKIQQKNKKQDSFINDQTSDSDSESIYHTALTNPKTSINSTTSKPTSVPVLVKKIQAICDTDTEDENDKSDGSFKKRLKGKRLSFSDDESSLTSEFDPGDYVPPKYICKKGITAKTPQPSKITRKFESTTTNKSATHKSFLESLSDTVPMSNVHPHAKKYRLDYKNNKEDLCKELYKLYNEKIFHNELPGDMTIEWNVRMRGTAGFCYNKKSVKSLTGVVKSSRIVLATKILDTPSRLRDTLIHEMCHAAAWLINNVSDGHGLFWTEWTNRARRTFPELPPIRRCHDYEIKTKFTYRCTSCGYSIGRHSKSLNIDKKLCGHCYGKFELLINKTTKSGTHIQMQTPKREPSGFALYVKQNYNSVKKEKNNIKHADVMKILGQQFSAIKIAKKDDLVTENDPGTSGLM